jgi:hypothetical protein
MRKYTLRRYSFFFKEIEAKSGKYSGIVSKPVQKLVGRLTLFQGISQVLGHHKTI